MILKVKKCIKKRIIIRPRLFETSEMLLTEFNLNKKNQIWQLSVCLS